MARLKCIERWVQKGGGLISLIDDPEERKHPLIALILEADQVKQFVNYYELPLVEEAQEYLNSDKGCDIILYIQFIWSLINLSQFLNEYAEASSLGNRLMNLNLDNEVKEVQAFRIYAYGISKKSGGSLEYEKFSKEARKVLPENSSHHYFYLLTYSYQMALQHRYFEVEATLEKFYQKKNKPAFFDNGYFRIKVFNDYLMQDYDSGVKKEKSLSVNDFGERNFESLKMWKIFPKILKNHFTSIDDLELELKSINKSDSNKTFYYTFFYLFKGMPKKALELMRQSYSEIQFMSDRASVTSYTHIRVELSNRNTQAAKALLIQKSKMNKHYMDDFFWSRIYLQENKRKLASDYYSNVCASCKYYKTDSLIDAELNLSCELSASDVRFLVSNVNLKIKSIDDKHQSLISKSEQKDANEYIGKSQIIQQVTELIGKFAKTDFPVLITGETGTGKEVTAHEVHRQSNRRAKPFLAINCGAITESLLQSELFGHAAGAFTGAEKIHKGIFESAGKGSVFLDEIGEISSSTQIVLLRVLELNEIRPVGSASPKPIHCKIIAATNANLEQLVDEGKFRQDLYYRLKRLEILLPPLRERKLDIPLFVETFFAKNQVEGQKPIVSTELMDFFINYSWPGNIRELKNEIETMRILSSEKLNYDISDSSLFNSKKLTRVKALDTMGKEAGIHSNLKKLENLRSNSKKEKRLTEIKKLFDECYKLTRTEIANVIGVTLPTTTKDLKLLLNEGYIKKVTPTASPSTHYFILSEAIE